MHAEPKVLQHEATSGRHGAATKLRQRLSAVLRLEEGGFEDWEEFLCRRREAEDRLAAELSSWPRCRLIRSPSGTYVCLLLEGTSVFSPAGVFGGCQAWLAEVESLAGPDPSPRSRQRDRQIRARQGE